MYSPDRLVISQHLFYAMLPIYILVINCRVQCKQMEMNASFRSAESWERWTNVGLDTHSLGEARTTLKGEWYCRVRANMSNSNGDGKGAMCTNTPKPKKSSKYKENSVQEWLMCWLSWTELSKEYLMWFDAETLLMICISFYFFT